MSIYPDWLDMTIEGADTDTKIVDGVHLLCLQMNFNVV